MAFRLVCLFPLCERVNGEEEGSVPLTDLAMEGGGQHGNDDTVDFFSQNNHTGMDFYSQAESSDVGHGIPLRLGYQQQRHRPQLAGGGVPQFASYQEVLQRDVSGVQQGSRHRRGGNLGRGRGGGNSGRGGSNSGRGGGRLGRGGVSRPTASVGDAAANVSAPFRPPRTTPTGTRGGRAPSQSIGIAYRSAAPMTSGGTGPARVSANVEESEDQEEEDEDEALGNAISMSDGGDKANWNSVSTFIFCEICLKEMRARNTTGGIMSNRGYKNIKEKYFISTKLRHSIKQFRNRWNQLKGLYQFWLRINRKTGLGRAQWWLMIIFGKKTARENLSGRSSSMPPRKI